MKIFFLSLLISFSIVNFSNAQSFSFLDPKTQNLTPTCAGYDDFYVHMRNEKTDSLRMQWKALANPLDSCWSFQYSMCDNYQCYLGIPGTSTTMTTIFPGDTTFLKFSNTAMTHFSGTPVVKVLVWDMDIPSEMDTITFFLTICPDSVACDFTAGINPVSKQEQFQLFPNPAGNEISMTVTVAENTVAVIYDLSGKQIITVPVKTGNNKLNIAWLDSGIYFVKIVDRGKQTGIQKFVKN